MSHVVNGSNFSHIMYWKMEFQCDWVKTHQPHVNIQWKPMIRSMYVDRLDCYRLMEEKRDRNSGIKMWASQDKHKSWEGMKGGINKIV